MTSGRKVTVRGEISQMVGRDRERLYERDEGVKEGLLQIEL